MESEFLLKSNVYIDITDASFQFEKESAPDNPASRISI